MARPGEPGQASDREEELRRGLAALRARLGEDALALRAPEGWAGCLRLAALMPAEEFANIVLVAAQRPGATMVRDYRQWTSMGRQVRRGEKGIEAFAVPPRPEQRSERKEGHDRPEPGWRDADRVTHVWDLSQTTGQPPAAPAGLPPPGQAPAELLDALRWLARREGFAVEREQGAPADGTTFWGARRIRLLPGLGDDQAVWALAHQLGHILLDHGSGLPAGTTTSGCAGIRKAEADAVAFVVTARHGVTAAADLAHPVSWAGSDPRAQPAAALLAAGQRITAAAAGITRHTDRILHGDDPAPAIPALPQHAALAARPRPDGRGVATAPGPAAGRPAPARPPAEPAASTRRILGHARDFYAGQLGGSWAPGYLNGRGVSAAVAAEWQIGYAPAGWTALTDHLRGHGHSDDEIEAAGVARPSSRGTLIDRFRDRVMLPVDDEQGRLAGFIGRARPGAADGVPKYLNSPKAGGYNKGSLLFGLARARPALARGAVPVIVEGPFDAIAVTHADPGRHAGLAPCGTALTSRQAELISQVADLSSTGILVAFDADAAGRKAAVRAYGILRPHTPNLQAARLNAKDPAGILQQDGPAALRVVLREHREPLAALVIDAHIEEWDRYLGDTEGRFRAMHSTASLIAGLLPGQTAAQVSQLTGGRDLVLLDDMLHPVDNPRLPQIARIVPADAACQVVRAAGTLGFDVSEVLAEVANAVTRRARAPKGQRRVLRDDPSASRPDRGHAAPVLADGSFPRPPLASAAGTVPAASLSRVRPSASRPRPGKHAR
jgi:DNA primase